MQCGLCRRCISRFELYISTWSLVSSVGYLDCGEVVVET